MNVKVFVVIGGFFLSLNIWAKTKNESADTIPFVNYNTRVIYVPAATLNSSPQNATVYAYQSIQCTNKTSNQPLIPTQEAYTSNVPISDLQNLIKLIRKAVCSSVGNSDVKVWVSIDASGKLLGVGASTQSGLEVTFHCKEERRNAKKN